MIPNIKLWGTATVGAKGQIVIPAEAREALGITEGDKLVVVSGPGEMGAVLFKADVFESFIGSMTSNLAAFKNINSEG